MPRVKKDLHGLLFPLHRAHPRRARASADGENPALLAIWDVIARIPRGSVTTYGAVARAAGLPGRARQAGYALKHMPEGMHLPWHRVVGAGGRIAFSPGSRPHREQTRLLRSEGVEVKDGRVAKSALTVLEEL
jgi:methylated-DNA-protein-cysteine methyltransferase related protein